MTRNMRRMGMALGAAAAVVALTAGGASAQGFASDSYKIGSNPAAGEYPDNTSLFSTALNTHVQPGFATGRYGGGTGTLQFQTTSGGLAYAPLGITGAESGKVSFLNPGFDATSRVNARNLSPTAPSSSEYWIGHLMSRGGSFTTTPTATSYLLTGFGNTTQPVLGATSGTLLGLFTGFAGVNSDLVIRYRDAAANTSADVALLPGGGSQADTTYQIVMRLAVNVSGGSTDVLSWWVNPTDFSSEAGLNATALNKGTINTFAFSDPTSFTRLNYAALGWAGNGAFDEARIGTSLASTFPAATASVPEPGTLTLAFAGIGSLGLVAARRRRAKAA